MNIKVHEISQVTCVLITHRCQGIRRKPVLTGKWGKRILRVLILGKLRSDNIQGQILPPHVYATGFHTGVTGQLESLRCLRTRKFTGEQTLKALLKAQPFSPFSSGINLLLLRHDAAWKAAWSWPLQPATLSSRYRNTIRATSDRPCSLACFSLQCQHNYLDK